MSVLKGDPERGGFIKQAIEQHVPALAPKG